MVFHSDAADQGAGWEAVIQCRPRCQSVELGSLTTDPPTLPADTGWVDICPGEAVTFSASGRYLENGTEYTQLDATSRFSWTFGDSAHAEGPTVSHTFTEPGGYVVQLKMSDVRGCAGDEVWTRRVRVAPPPVFTLNNPLPPVCAGDTLRVSAGPAGADINFSFPTTTFNYHGTHPDTLALPDGDGKAYSTSIRLSGFPATRTLTDIDDLSGICVNMEHSWMNELTIWLTCPSGRRVSLLNYDQSRTDEVLLGLPVDLPNQDGPGQGFDYCWTPTGTESWKEFVDNNGGGPLTVPAGNYASEGPLTDLSHMK